MHHPISRAVLAGALAACLGATAAAAAQTAEQAGTLTTSQKPSVPPLHLSDAQHAAIRQALSSQDTELTFTLKTTKPAASFQPSVGAKIPHGLKLHPLPRPLIYKMPLLKRYTYLKFKHQVLIVNPMTHKIVDMFAEAGS